MTRARHNERFDLAAGQIARRFAPALLGWLLMACLLVQTPATAALAAKLARTAPAANLPSEEERPTETTETPTASLAVSQGRRASRSIFAPQTALRMPLLNASGCMAACHLDGGRMLVCDVRLGTGLPLRL